MNRWERVSLEEGILAGIDALADAYTTGEPQTAIRRISRSEGEESRRMTCTGQRGGSSRRDTRIAWE